MKRVYYPHRFEVPLERAEHPWPEYPEWKRFYQDERDEWLITMFSETAVIMKISPSHRHHIHVEIGYLQWFDGTPWAICVFSKEWRSWYRALSQLPEELAKLPAYLIAPFL